MAFLLATSTLLFRNASHGNSIPPGAAHSLPSLEGHKCPGIVEDCPLDPPFLSDPLSTSETVSITDIPHHQSGIAHVTWSFYRAGTTGKSVRATFAATGNSNEENATARERKGFLDEVHKRFDHS
jgi:hypothetical protein